jgi:hypothetical protein
MFDAPMVIIAQTPLYHLKVEREKNRIYLNLLGTWNKPEEVPFYLVHLKEALDLVRPGFSILTDSRVLEEYAPSVRQLHIDAQKMTIKAGISQVAEVHESNNSVNQVIVAIAEESKIPLNIFDSIEDADAWLSETHPK